MLVLRFFRYILGYVAFTAKGGFPERFINLCRKNGINLWNLRCSKFVISACTDCEGYKKIRTAARKSGMRVKLKKKYGLPFFIERHSRRIGLAVGACFCMAAVIILSTRIWSIDVTGNVDVPAETVIGVFEELGVRKGVSGSKIDIRAVEIEALNRLPEISWLNINIAGSAARIEVRETVKSPEISEDDSEPADIVAAKDGQIVILRPFNGTQEKTIGSPVLKGDLLISGIREKGDMTVNFCRASGYVVARTSRKINVSQDKTVKATRAIGTKNSYILDFIFFSVPIGIQKDGAYKNKSEIVINGVTLPVSITECTYNEYESIDVTLNQAQAEQLAMHRFFDECAEELRFVEVEDVKISADKNGVSGEFTCLENIGAVHPMQIEQTN